MSTQPTPAPTPRTDALKLHPDGMQHARFEGCDSVIIAPEDYATLYEHAQLIECELAQAQTALAAAQATAREAMEEADHYKRIFKSNGASMELMASRIPTGGQVIDAVIRAAAVTADSPGVLVWSANAAEQIEAALAKIAEEGQATP